MKLWIAGKRTSDPDGWEFQGIFDSEALAVAACLTRDYFIGPAELNLALPDERAEYWPGCRFPLAEPAV